MRHIPFQKAVKSFLGYLEGTSKSLHTQNSYKQDLRTFADFWDSHSPKKMPELSKIQARDLKKYFDFLKSQGFRTNSRRRKILTLRKFFQYATRRGYTSLDPSLHIIPPQKSERIPRYYLQLELLEKIRSMPTSSFLDRRNKVMLWILVETACTVSEICQLRYDQWSEKPKHGEVELLGNNGRTLKVSRELFQNVLELKRASIEKDYLFLGHNRFGDLGSPITPRGIELLVKWFGKSHGFPLLTPRALRHSAAISWLKAGKSMKEVQAWLGLNTRYSLRVYEPLIKQDMEISK